jgi:uridine kinase
VELFEPYPVIIVDGTLLLSQERLRKELSDSLFIRCPESLRLERRKARDVQERGRTLEGVIRQFERHVKPMHDTFVESSSHLARRILEEPLDYNLFVEQLAKEYQQKVPT